MEPLLEKRPHPLTALDTPAGKIEFAIPNLRRGGYFPI